MSTQKYDAEKVTKDEMEVLSLRIRQSEIDRAEKLVDQNLRDQFTGLDLSVLGSNNRSTILRVAIQLGLLVLEKAPHGFCTGCGEPFVDPDDVWSIIRMSLGVVTKEKRLCKKCGHGDITVKPKAGDRIEATP